MTEEEKKLLLIDLCARLPHGVKVKNVKNNFDISNFNHNVEEIKILIEEYDIKPYLRPMSSMTEEEKKYISERCGFSIVGPIRNECELIMPVFATDWLIDFYNEHHFDYRGLIPMGLALEAPEGMYKTK